MFKRKEKDVFPTTGPVKSRKVTFYLPHNVVMSSDTTIPIEVLAWYIRNRSVVTFSASRSNEKSMIICMGDVLSIITESEIREEKTDVSS